MFSPRQFLRVLPLFFGKNMFDKYIQYDDKGQQIAQGANGWYTKQFRRHICGTDYTGTDQKRHDP